MKQRIQSVDVLRGMTIFLMIMVNTPGSWAYIYAPLQHAEWHGCTPTDMVFPSFLFVVGLSMFISFKRFDPAQKNAMLIKVLRRGAMIFLIGILLNWFPFYHKNISDLRIFGVLQRIALAFIGAGIVMVMIRNIKTLLFIIATLLLGHWAILYGFGGADPYTLEGNISSSLDIMLFGTSHIYKGFGIPFDPEGLLGTLPGIAHVLLGYVIGHYALSFGVITYKRLRDLGCIAVSLIAGGLLWNMVLPINKPLWTGSYVLYTIGIVTAIWAFLIWIVDLKQLRSWSFVFRVFGRNPLISFVLSIFFVKIFIYLIKIEGISFYNWSYQQLFKPVLGAYFGSFIYALSFTLFIWLFAYWLYRKGKMIKV